MGVELRIRIKIERKFEENVWYLKKKYSVEMDYRIIKNFYVLIYFFN